MAMGVEELVGTGMVAIEAEEAVDMVEAGDGEKKKKRDSKRRRKRKKNGELEVE